MTQFSKKGGQTVATWIYVAQTLRRDKCLMETYAKHMNTTQVSLDPD